MITFVTGNANKLRELQQLAPPAMQIRSQAVELDEPQSLSLRDIVTHKLQQAYAVVGAPVIVEDVSAGLGSLNGLPGPFIKFFEQQLGRGALYSLSKVEHDSVTITCLAGYYDGNTMLFGTGIINGHIVAPRGDNGFGFDCVVVPGDGGTAGSRTMAEMTDTEKNQISHRFLALGDLVTQIALGDTAIK